MNFKQQIAKYISNNLPSEELPELAMQGIKENFDSPSLHILAGLNKQDCMYEGYDYFRYAMSELKIALPDSRQATLEYLLAVVDEIIDGNVDILKAIKEITGQVLYNYHFSDENKYYCYDSIHFEKAYGLIDTIDELTTADYPWRPGKTNKELIEEVIIELVNEFKKWKLLIKVNV